MSIADRITEELKTAMKARDQVKMDTLRMVKSDFNNAKIDKKADLTEDEMIGIIQKSVKKRQDSVEAYTAGNRQDLVDRENREIEILKTFLPAQLSEAELQSIVKEVIAQTGVASKKDMGKVMGALMPKVKGKADGRLVQQIVSSLLS